MLHYVNYVLLRNNLSQYKNIFQYAYSNVFPEIYCATEKRGFDLKSTFYKDKKIEQFGKNPQNYKNAYAETSVFEQKPIKIDDFNEAEEKEAKELVKKEKWNKEWSLKKTSYLEKRKSKRKMRKIRKKCGTD